MASSPHRLDALESGASDPSEQWSRLLGPYLEQALISTRSYTTEEIRNHLAFFRTCVTTWLGPPPNAGSMLSPEGVFRLSWAPAFPSALTSDHTPLEISYSWKRADGEGSTTPVVRFVTDIIPKDGEQSRSASLTEGMRTIETLQLPVCSSTIDVFGWPDLWECITSQLAQSERSIHPPGSRPCAACSPSSTFIGFDLARSHVKAKLYWLMPSCQTMPALLMLLDGIFAVCVAEGHFARLRNFAFNWAQIRGHLSTHSDSLCPRMLSLDATKYPFPRLKLYSRCYFRNDEPFDTIQSHLNLNNAIALPANFLHKCRALWSCLLENYRGNEPQSPQDQAQQKYSKYCMVLHEISPTSLTEGTDVDSCLKCKLYLFCKQVPGHDVFVVKELLGRFEGPAAFFRRYEILSSPTFISAAARCCMLADLARV